MSRSSTLRLSYETIQTYDAPFGRSARLPHATAAWTVSTGNILSEARARSLFSTGPGRSPIKRDVHRGFAISFFVTVASMHLSIGQPFGRIGQLLGGPLRVSRGRSQVFVA